MPVYAYKGFTQAGKNVQGTKDADNPKSIKTSLKREGIYITELKEAATSKVAGSKGRATVASRFGERVSAQELAVVTRQLATLVGAGIPLVESLTALVDQIDNAAFKAVWADVKARVNEGAGFGDALGAYPKFFSSLYVNMVRAGESSGALEVVLERLADFTESQAMLKGKLIGTMIYPILMIFMASGVMGILFVFVIPRISKIFEAQKVALPVPTRILMGFAGFVAEYGLFLLPVVLGLVVLTARYLRSPKGKPKWDKFILKVPLFGPLVRMVAITRFSKTLGTLISSGVPLLTAFDIVRAVVQNQVLMDVIETARESVKEGESIASPLKRSGEFPPIVTHMIAVGERSGQLEEMLANVARSFDAQVSSRLQAMTSLLEPLLLVMMGGVVAFIVFSVLMPMLQLSTMAGH